MSESQGSTGLHLVELYKKLLTIRKFEEAVARLYADGEIPGFVHLYVGEEAVAVGVCATLRASDYITSTHRGHGHAIAKGANLKLMMSELFGKRTGYCKGKGGSMHIADLDLGILGANGIVGGGLGIATGAGYSIRLRESDQVVAAFFGDGASNEGLFHEALNMCAAWDLPVVFVCENNSFGVSTRIDRITRQSDLAKRATAYDMSSATVDGNDVLAVEKAAQEAVENARRGKGPTLLICRTFRFRGHFEGETVNYWKKDELAQWKRKDPLPLMTDHLKSRAAITDQQLEAWGHEIDAAIGEAVEYARESPFPAPEDALDDLFWEASSR